MPELKSRAIHRQKHTCQNPGPTRRVKTKFSFLPPILFKILTARLPRVKLFKLGAETPWSIAFQKLTKAKITAHMGVMDLKLVRIRKASDGVFSELFDENGHKLASCIEHAYPNGDGKPQLWGPKLPPGRYVCNRGMHRLHGMQSDFETFEITGVPGHTNILFHPGNTQADSEGCVLVGRDFCRSTPTGPQIINCSRITFDALMVLQVGQQQFSLEVVD